MRISAAVLLLWLGGCSSLPGLEEPTITLVPQMGLLEFKGSSSMPEANLSVPLSEIGLNGRGNDYGAIVRVGDGFSGFDAGVFVFDQKPSQTGILSQDWGNLMQGDTVKTELEGVEAELRYIAEFFDYEFDNGVVFQLGGGGAIAHRRYSIESHEINGMRAQELEMKDRGALYAAGRARVSYLDFGIVADYAISPGTNFGGDIDGLPQDLKLLATYTFEDQDLSIFGGYRRSWLEASGQQDQFTHKTEFTIDGYLFGLEFSF